MKGITFQAKAGIGEVFIYDDIGGFRSDVTAKTFTDELKALGNLSELNIRINSGGGSVFDGVAIYNAIKRHEARTIIHIDGLAASIASVVAMAGDEVRMAENALFMLHDPWTVTSGNAADFRSVADTLDKIRGTLLEAYVDKSSNDRDVLSAMMTEETWLNSDEAQEAGLVDVITDEMAIAAHCDPTRFHNAPDRLSEIIKAEAPEPSAEIKTMTARMAQTLRKRGL